MPANLQSDLANQPQSLRARLRSVSSIVILHVKKHAGVGMVCAVAYFDPGNWGVDLQAGSQFGFRLLFVVLLAGIFAAFFQVLAARLGCVTGLSLASHCRILFYDRPSHPLFYRRLVLYPLYVLSEVAIIATDLAELLGSAIALCLLFPKLQLWHGVLITAFDVILLLALRDPLRSAPVKMFEIFVTGLVLAVLMCMVIVITKVNVEWAKAFEGFLPSKYIFGDSALYTCRYPFLPEIFMSDFNSKAVGILGATVMPHSLFLGSALATQDRLTAEASSLGAKLEPAREKTANTLCELPRINRLVKFLAQLVRPPPPSQSSARVKRHADRENNSLAFITAHLTHGIIDIVGKSSSLQARCSFYHNNGPKIAASASLFDAYDLIHEVVGAPAATLFAIALLASGQSSAVIATVAGQAVSEGFLNWRVSPVLRRVLTRLLAVIPALVVAIAVGRPGINGLLVASQVILAIVLPFITLPLIYLTSSKTFMRVRRPDALVSTVSGTEDDMIDFSSGLATTILGCAIWLVMLTANIYVIVTMVVEVRH
ncbi:Manganese transporter pdt1 [Mycena sanguinolenta]|uniref:Manganese transporter pdt1 n=1 Tax=Mycena sanguinolenta TaxID=230812 RepID=A0A8H6XNP6_9AGAR|nr:Manganese transporter pdt1 [Mycena sanguinolenta]